MMPKINKRKWISSKNINSIHKHNDNKNVQTNDYEKIRAIKLEKMHQMCFAPKRSQQR